MNTLDLITSSISFLSVIVSLVSLLRTLVKSKEEYFQLRNARKVLSNNIKNINQNSVLREDNGIYKNYSQDDVKMILYWYCYSVINTFKEFYPEHEFCISIKKIIDDSVCTILQAGEDLFIDKGKQYIRDNTEYNSIINEGYNYFFVTDLNSFQNKLQKYNSSDSTWNFKYNTSIVFPIRNMMDGEMNVVGFVCINSPQTLRKRKINEYLVKLIKTTSENLGNLLLYF